jgi:hypothetical protein
MRGHGQWVLAYAVLCIALMSAGALLMMGWLRCGWSHTAGRWGQWIGAIGVCLLSLPLFMMIAVAIVARNR